MTDGGGTIDKEVYIRPQLTQTMKPTRLWLKCPACGQRVQAIAWDGQVKGYCARAGKYVTLSIKVTAKDRSYMQDPEYRARQSKAMKQQWQDPLYRARQMANIDRLWQDPDFRARHSARLSHTKKPDYRARQSDHMKRLWQDPAYRAKRKAQT